MGEFSRLLPPTIETNTPTSRIIAKATLTVTTTRPRNDRVDNEYGRFACRLGLFSR
jgi:hypothetical protein